MFFLLWQGWGFLVPLLVGVSFVITQFLVNAFVGPLSYETNTWPKVVAVILAAVSIWFVGRHFNNKPGRELIDKKTGKDFVLKSQSTFFFIKMEYWAFIVLLLSIIIYFS